MIILRTPHNIIYILMNIEFVFQVRMRNLIRRILTAEQSYFFLWKFVLSNILSADFAIKPLYKCPSES